MSSSTIIPSVIQNTDNLQLVLPEFGFTVDASCALFASYSTNIPNELHVKLTANVDEINQAFQYFTEDVDLLQGTPELDLQFRYVEPAGGPVGLFSSFADSIVVQSATDVSLKADGPISVQTGSTTGVSIDDIGIQTASFLDGFDATTTGDLSANRVTLADEYINYIAYALFNNTQGLDLFNNVKQLTNELNYAADLTLIDHNLTPLLDGGVGADPTTGHGGSNIYNKSGTVSDSSHPSELLLTQIEKLMPERLQNLVPDSNNTPPDANWYNNFLRVGDVISFNVTAKVHTGQNLTNNKRGTGTSTNYAFDSSSVNNNIIKNRIYTVDVHIVDI